MWIWFNRCIYNIKIDSTNKISMQSPVIKLLYRNLFTAGSAANFPKINYFNEKIKENLFGFMIQAESFSASPWGRLKQVFRISLVFSKLTWISHFMLTGFVRHPFSCISLYIQACVFSVFLAKIITSQYSLLYKSIK